MAEPLEDGRICLAAGGGVDGLAVAGDGRPARDGGGLEGRADGAERAAPPLDDRGGCTRGGGGDAEPPRMARGAVGEGVGAIRRCSGAGRAGR